MNKSVYAQNKRSNSKKINYTKISTSDAKSLGFPVIYGVTKTNKKSSLASKNSLTTRKKKKPFRNNQNYNGSSSNYNQTSNLNVNVNQVDLSNFRITSQTTKTLVNSSKNYKQTSIKYSKTGTPIFISSDFKGEISKFSKKTKKTIALEYLEELKETLLINNPLDEFEFKDEKSDQLGFTHLKLKQVYNSVPVYAKEIIIHLDRNGAVKSLTGNYFPTPKEIETNPRLKPENILNRLPEILNKNLKELKVVNESIIPKLIIYEKNDKLFLSWLIEIYSSQIDRWEIIIDDKSGDLIDKINTTCSFIGYDEKKNPHNHSHEMKTEIISSTTGTGIDLNGIERSLNTFLFNNTYWLIDTTKPSYNSATSSGLEQTGSISTLKYGDDNNFYFQDNPNNLWDDPSLVSAHHNASLVFDYFHNTHQRNSIDGKGGRVLSFTNIKDSIGQDVDNAYWNGRNIAYGNGKDTFKPLAGALDVAAHEFTHGVVQATANLRYIDESGALNESFSDIFGVMVDRDDWTLGEDIVKDLSYKPNGFLRSMREPEKGDQPSHYSNLVFIGTDIDNGGVHYNSGVSNKAFYLIASEIGKDKSEKIYYRALTTYLTSSSGFSGLRVALEESAKDLYGENSLEHRSVLGGLEEVGIVVEQIEEEVTYTYEGSDFILFHDKNSEDPATLYLTDPTGSEFYTEISQTEIYGKPSISADGFFVCFIDKKFNLIGITIDDLENVYEYTLSETGDWNSVSISKDKSKVALTTFSDKNIHVYDFNSQEWKLFELYTPTTAEGVKSDEIVYADALEWDNKSEIVIFDQLNRTEIGNSENDTYWDIGLLHVWNSDKNRFASGNIIKLFSQIPDSVSVGYPSFAKTRNDIITFDWEEKVSGEEYKYYIATLNLETSEMDFFDTYSNYWGSPNYNSSDTEIIYNYRDSNYNRSVLSREIENYINPTLNETALYISEAEWGVAFNQGLRDFDQDGVIDDYDLCPNSPAGAAIDESGCSLSQLDTDKDDVYEDLDNCILEFNPDQLDTDGDGTGDECDEDDDGDGVVDERDLCPNTPIDSIVDLNGCKIFSLPVNNYSISVAEVSCAGENDGSITFSVEDKTYDYIATISNKSSSKGVVNSSKNARSCTPSITFAGSNVQTVGQGESAEQVTFVVTNTCSMEGSTSLKKLYYNGQGISLAEKNPFENYSLHYIATRGINKGKLCDGTFSCTINSEPDTDNTIIFNAKVKEDAVLGEYMLIDNKVLSDNSEYSIEVTIIVVEAGSTGTSTITNSRNSTDTSTTGESIQLNPSNNHSGNFKNLEPGVYDICLKVIGEDRYEQCFELMVKEPQPLSASSKVDNSDGSVEFNLRGSNTYYLRHNGNSNIIETDNPVISLMPGLNTVEIYTENNCQGIITKEFFNSEEVEYYPNPTSGIVNFYIHGNDNIVNVNKLDSKGNSIMNNSFNVPLSRKIQIDFSENMKGVYFVKFNSERVKKTIKIIKE